MPKEYLNRLSIEDRERAWQSRLRKNPHELWVACENELVVGWAYASKSRDPGAAANTAELCALNVDAAWWRRGVGRALLSEVEPALLHQGFATWTLWVLQDNARALGFYAALGFQLNAGQRKVREFGETALYEVQLSKTLAA